MVNVEVVRSKIFNSVIAAEVSKGHLKWKVSDIARITGVSRPLIYYHFGISKEAILYECLNVLAKEYYGLTNERRNLLKAGRLLESLLQTRKMFIKNPSIVVFYQKWRMQSESPIRRLLIEIECKYQEKLNSEFPHLNGSEIKTLHALFHGVVCAPFLNTVDFEVAVESITKLFRLTF